MNTEIDTVTPEPTPMTLIQAAMESGCDPDRLEKLLALQERYQESIERQEAREAARAYNVAMRDCQSEMLPITANMINTHTKSRYADLKQVVEKAQPIYTRYGFSVSSWTEPTEKANHVRVGIEVMHDCGHSKVYQDDFPLDDAGARGGANKTPIQAKASSTSYARRYLICGAFNLQISRDDRDGNAPVSTISDKQVKALHAICERIPPGDREDAVRKLCEWASVSAIDVLPSHLYLQAKQGLEARIAE